MTADTDVLVIGAGPAGLTAAYSLAKAGRAVTVIERDPVCVGGISRTIDCRGHLFGIGGDRFFSKSKAVTALWDEILPDGFVERPRLSRIFHGGKFYAYPLRALEALGNLGLLTSVRCMASYAAARLRPVENPATFHERVRNQFGEKLFSIFFKTYAEKKWGVSCDDIPMERASEHIAGQGKVQPLSESFRYPRKGPGTVWEAAAEHIRARSGALRMGESLETARWDVSARVWAVTTVTAAGERRTLTANHLVSSAPVAELAGALKPAPLSLLHARRLRYRDVLTVALIARTTGDLPDEDVYIHDPAVKVGRVRSSRSWSRERTPEAGTTCLGLEYFCFESDGLWSAGDDDLIALAKREIEHIGLIRPQDVVDACVVRQAKAYPIYDDEHRHNMQMIRLDLERSFPTLHLVGRNGMHRCDNQGQAMMTAMLTAQNILAGKRIFDVWQVSADGEADASGSNAALSSERPAPKRAAAA